MEFAWEKGTFLFILDNSQIFIIFQRIFEQDVYINYAAFKAWFDNMHFKKISQEKKHFLVPNFQKYDKKKNI